MKLRTLSLGLVFVLVVAACGDDSSDTATDSGSDEIPTSLSFGDETSDSDDGGSDRGWLEGEPPVAPDGEALLSGSGDAMTEEAASDSFDSYGGDADFAYADEVASSSPSPTLAPRDDIGPIDPPIDYSPLRAGSIDDAEDVAAFLDYRNRIRDFGVPVRPLDLTDSTVFTVVGNNGLPVLDALVEFWDPEADRSTALPVVTLRTTANGSVRFLPHAMAEIWSDLDAAVRVGGLTVDVDHTWGDPAVTVNVDAPGGVDGSVPLDVHFVLDATGSMGDEISRLRDNMTAVAQQVDALPSAPDVRFGMTIYRDEGDEFVTRTFDLTDDLGSFLDALDDVVADGGGDYPEAMDEALADALEKPSWRRAGAVELMFVIADAPPQISRQVEFSTAATAITAAELGVKIFPVAASGTDDQTEYVMRELAFVTGGRFVFLSHGVDGTATGDQTDISADDYDELPLDQLIVKLIADELAALAGEAGVVGQTTTTTVPVTTTTFEQ